MILAEISEPAVVTVDADFEEEFPDARRAATMCSATMLRTASRLLSEIDMRRRPLAPLSATAFEILAVIEGAHEPVSPHVIAERLLVTSGTTTSILDTLERRGLITRVPHPSDRRKLLIDITDEARAMVDKMLPLVHGASRDVFSVFSDAECETFVGLLKRIQGRLDELAEADVQARGERRRRPGR